MLTTVRFDLMMSLLGPKKNRRNVLCRAPPLPAKQSTWTASATTWCCWRNATLRCLLHPRNGATDQLLMRRNECSALCPATALTLTSYGIPPLYEYTSHCAVYLVANASRLTDPPPRCTTIRTLIILQNYVRDLSNVIRLH